MSQQRLLDMLPEHFAILKEMIEIAKVEGKKFDKLDDDIEDLLDQMYIHTATWGLGYWEERYLLPVLDSDKDHEKRRRRILRKKRSNKANLVDIAKAVEPSLYLSWGGLTLPFTIEKASDYYDFGELIVALEEEKPSHLSYSFRLRPNGYTVKSFRYDRYSVALKLLSGTARAGRWPKANTRGESLHKVVNINLKEVTGMSKYSWSAGLVSGNRKKQTSFGHVGRGGLIIESENVSGSSLFNRSGGIITGTLSTKAVSNSIGLEANCATYLNVGQSHFPCGARASGEGV